MPTFSISNAGNVVAGNIAIFTVTMSGSISAPVTIWYSTLLGSASAADGDYPNFYVNLPLTFNPGGSNTQQIFIPTLVSASSSTEGPETFGVGLQSTQTGNPFTSGSATILPNTVAAPTFSISNAGNVTAGNNAVFTVTMNGSISAPVTIWYSTFSGTASASDGDYPGTYVNLPLTFSPGGSNTQQILIPTLTSSGSSTEGSETFSVGLQSTQFGGAFTTGTATILPNAASAPTFSISNAGNVTAGNNAVFTVTMNGSISAPVTIWYSTLSGTASAADGDYPSNYVNLPLTFNPDGSNTQQITIPTLVSSGSSTESAETFSVGLQSTQGGNAFTSGAATILPNSAAAAPNLVIDSLTLGTSSLAAGHAETINFAIGNAGSSSAGASTARIYLSSNPAITSSATLLGTVSIPSLAGGGSYSSSLTPIIPAGLTPGTYYVGLTVDPVANETSTADNSISKSFTVTAQQPVVGYNPVIVPGGTVSQKFGNVDTWGDISPNSTDRPPGDAGLELTHPAVDIEAPLLTPVDAFASGTVTMTGYSDALGWYVLVQDSGSTSPTVANGENFSTLYLHFANQPLVTQNQSIPAGFELGTVGTTGNETGVAAGQGLLHFEIRLFTGLYQPYSQWNLPTQNGSSASNIYILGSQSDAQLLADPKNDGQGYVNPQNFISENGNAPPTTPGLVDSLTTNPQLELIYLGYFNRAADGGGLNYWGTQNAQAQNGGQTIDAALTNIADLFAPQQETIALYPFLESSGTDLTTPTAQAGLGTLIANVYQNLFDRAADAAGAAYWLGQVTSGAIGLGSAILAIANGATGTDATELQNKITVALDFTNRTNAAGLDGAGASSASFLTAAHNVLNGVDGTSLNDASVTAGENATTAYISSATKSTIAASTASANMQPLAATTQPITVSASNSAIDPGAGSYAIQFLDGTNTDTLVLHNGGTDQIAGFDPSAGDVLDLRSLFEEAQLNVQDVLLNLDSYFTIASRGPDAALLFDPLGQGHGTAIAVLQNLGSTVTDFGSLTKQNAVLA